MFTAHIHILREHFRESFKLSTCARQVALGFLSGSIEFPKGPHFAIISKTHPAQFEVARGSSASRGRH